MFRNLKGLPPKLWKIFPTRRSHYSFKAGTFIMNMHVWRETRDPRGGVQGEKRVESNREWRESERKRES